MEKWKLVPYIALIIALFPVSGNDRLRPSFSDSRKINIVGEMSWTEPEFSTAWRRPQKLSFTPHTTSTSDLAQPQFYNNSTTKIFAPRGGTASIECHVKNLGDRAVSWIRKRDLHILTIGSITYTADRRFTSSQNEDSTVWRLTIHPTLHSDTGLYECQISTEPKISKLHDLNITDAESKIQSSPSVYVREGSLLNVTCTFQGHFTPAHYIHWFRGKHLLNTSDRGGINIISDKVLGWSNLVISKSKLSDSGNYSCQPSNALPDTVNIHVLTGGDLAAIQEPEGLTGSTIVIVGGGVTRLILTGLVVYTAVGR